VASRFGVADVTLGDTLGDPIPNMAAKACRTGAGLCHFRLLSFSFVIYSKTKVKSPN
jgi:hypothetical protein